MHVMAITVLALSTFGAGYALQQGAQDKDKFEGAPAAVRSAAMKLCEGMTIDKVKKETDKDIVTWEIESKGKDGSTRNVDLTDAGVVIAEENSMAIAQLPAAVQQAVAKAFPGGKLVSAEHVVKHAFEVVVEVDGKKHPVVVLPTGKLGGEEEGDEADDKGKEEKGKDGAKKQGDDKRGK